MISFSDHEFLQWLPDEMMGVLGPIVSMICSACSG